MDSIFKKTAKAFIGFGLLFFKVKIFRKDIIFNNKRIAIVGPASSALENENGFLIDGFDYVVRINKALITWNTENEKFLGTRTDILFHNFHENFDRGGGGTIDFELFKKFGVQYLVQSRFDIKGWRSVFIFFKKYITTSDTVYILSRPFYKKIKDSFGYFHPTRGYCALYTSLMSPSKEVFITGFTFFKTPYAKGYRDQLIDMTANEEHIKQQGLHNVNLEFENFLKLIENVQGKKIIVDRALYEIIKTESPGTLEKISCLKQSNI